MKRSRLVVSGAVLAAGAIVMSGCSAGSSGEKPTLSMWVNSATTDQEYELYERFEEESGYSLDVTPFPSDGFEGAVLQRWATGDRPDLLQWSGNYNWVAALNPADNLLDLTDEEFVGKTTGGLYDNAASIDGVVYGALINTPGSFGLYFNKDITSAAGIDTPPTTAAELLEACEKVKAYDPSIAPFLESAGSLWTPLVFHGSYMADSLQDGFLAQVNSRESRVNDPDSPWLASLEFYKQMQESGCFNADIMTAQFENSAQVLLDGGAAFVAMHTGFIQQVTDASDAETVASRIGWTPWAAERPVVTSETGGAYYVPKTGDTANEEGALEFVRFVTGPGYADYVAASKQLPILEGVETPGDLSSLWRSVEEGVNAYGSVPPLWASLPGITDLVNYPGQLILGELTPQTAVDLLQRQAEQGAEQAGLPAWED